MAENKISDIINSSLEGIKDFTNMDNVIGAPIHTPSGVTVIPVSKISVGFAGGGIDFGSKKANNFSNTGSGSGSGVSITPVAFLTIDKDGETNLIHVNNSADINIERITALIEHTPEIIKKAKKALKE